MVTEILHQISIWIIVLPFLVGIMNYRGLNRDSRWIFLLTCIALLPQLLTAFVAKENALFNITYNLYSPIEFFILYLLFYHKFHSKPGRLMLQASAVVYALLCGLFFLQSGIRASFLSGLVSINNLIYMLWILLLLKQEYVLDETIIQQQHPFTWYFIALILYAPCTVAVFALYHYIRDAQSPWRIHLSAIHSVFNVLQYLFFTIGLSLRQQIK